MQKIFADPFYQCAAQFDPDSDYPSVGEVEYYLLYDEKAHEGLRSHKEALLFVFEQLDPSGCDIDKAQAEQLDPQMFFYCPNIIRTDRYGNAWYDAEWKPDDDNIGTKVPYWYTLMEPIYGRRNPPEDFRKVNEILFPKGTDTLEIYEWTTDWSGVFDDGHEWYGSCCWSIYDKNMDRYIVMIVSATD